MDARQPELFLEPLYKSSFQANQRRATGSFLDRIKNGIGGVPLFYSVLAPPLQTRAKFPAMGLQFGEEDDLLFWREEAAAEVNTTGVQSAMRPSVMPVWSFENMASVQKELAAEQVDYLQEFLRMRG